ncbi:cysteine desulfurase [Fulvivirgaceae bacterium BMA10]|uniref:Probable cysteine desulfurase n=1 Tax=Splendidivirga corallicola TaxID=3051826 RepID=A0ABT8KL16_9BACT|nr:cysteine desulfurase [Fulvivirgaceae bacterium BMA10]
MRTSNQEILDRNRVKLNIEEIRKEFPILDQEVHGKPLVYFDNAATTQKPRSVIQALTQYYTGYNANIHRGIHTLAEKATTAFEATREAVRDFLNAAEVEEVIFTHGTTEGINLVASSYGKENIKEGDEIIISAMEHHSNIVPWQILCQEKGAHLKVIPVNEAGEIIFEEYEKLLNEKTKIVSIVHVSNTLGTINPIKEVIQKAHDAGAVVLIDGAQASSHLELDVQDLDCDFYVFSMHKLYGPTGSGILYGKRALLEKMPPYKGGGEMIKEVTFEKTTYNDIPYKFEAGTPNIADVVAIKSALDFVQELGKENIAEHENKLLAYANQKLSQIPGLKFIGTAKEKVSVISFVMEGLHHFDIGQMLDARGVAVRTGHHCTQPLMQVYGIEGTVRASFSVYNTKQEIDIMVEGLEKVVKIIK